MFDYSEYNKIHLPRAEHLEIFLKNLPHAIQKAGPKEVQEEILHQLKCIGYSEQFVADMCQVAHEYKEYHKHRIRAEQAENLPEVLYPTIREDRRPAYMKNLDLIEAIRKHPDAEDIYVNIADVIADHAGDVDAKAFFAAYIQQDADAMVKAICMHGLEDIFAAASVVPDTQELFFKMEDAHETFFPFYGKETISIEEFQHYLLSRYEIHDDAWKLIRNAIQFARSWNATLKVRQDILLTLLKDVIQVPEEIVRMLDLC